MYVNVYNVNYDVLKFLRPDVGLIDIKTSLLDKYFTTPRFYLMHAIFTMRQEVQVSSLTKLSNVC